MSGTSIYVDQQTPISVGSAAIVDTAEPTLSPNGSGLDFSYAGSSADLISALSDLSQQNITATATTNTPASSQGVDTAVAFNGQADVAMNTFLNGAAVVGTITDMRNASKPTLRPGMTDNQTIAAISQYVINRFNYIPDAKNTGWQTATSTINKGGGDCEDLVNLTGSLLLAAGINPDSVRAYVKSGTQENPGHVVLGLVGADGTVSEIDIARLVGRGSTVTSETVLGTPLNTSDYSFFYDKTAVHGKNDGAAENFGVFEDASVASSSYTAGEASVDSSMLNSYTNKYTLQKVTASQIGNISAWDFANVSVSVLNNLSPTQVAGITRAQVENISSDTRKNLYEAFISNLTKEALSATFLNGLSPQQLGYVTVAQMTKLAKVDFDSGAMAKLSLQSITGLASVFDDEHISQIPAAMFANLSAATINSFSDKTKNYIFKTQFEKIPLSVFRDLSAASINALNTNVIGTITADQISSLPPYKFGKDGLSAATINALSDTATAAITKEQIERLPDNVTKDTFSGTTISCMSLLNPTTLTSLNAANFSGPFLAGLRKDQLQRLTPDQIAALPHYYYNSRWQNASSVFGALSADQINSLLPAQKKAITSAQLMDIAAFGDLTAETINGLSDLTKAGITGNQVMSMSAMTIFNLHNSTINKINDYEARNALSKRTRTEYTAEFINGLLPGSSYLLTESQLNSMSNGAIAGLTPSTISKLNGANLQFDFIQHLADSQLNALTAKQIKAIPTADFSMFVQIVWNLSPSPAINSLSDEAKAAISPAQMAASTIPAYLLLISPATIDKLSAETQTQFYANIKNNLTGGVLQYMDKSKLTPKIMSLINPATFNEINNTTFMWIRVQAPGAVKGITAEQIKNIRTWDIQVWDQGGQQQDGSPNKPAGYVTVKSVWNTLDAALINNLSDQAKLAISKEQIALCKDNFPYIDATTINGLSDEAKKGITVEQITSMLPAEIIGLSSPTLKLLSPEARQEWTSRVSDPDTVAFVTTLTPEKKTAISSEVSTIIAENSVPPTGTGAGASAAAPQQAPAPHMPTIDEMQTMTQDEMLAARAAFRAAERAVANRSATGSAGSNAVTPPPPRQGDNVSNTGTSSQSSSGANLTAELLNGLNTPQIYKLTPDEVKGINVGVFASLKTPTINALLGSATYANITSTQLDQIPESVVKDLSADSLNIISLLNISEDFKKKLAKNTNINQLTSDQKTKLGVAGTSESSTTNTPGPAAATTPALSSMQGANLTAELLNDTSNTAQLGTLTDTQVGSIPKAEFAKLLAATINALFHNNYSAITKDQLEQIPANVIKDLSVATISSLNGANLTTTFLAKLTPTQLGSLTKEQVAAIKPDEFANITAGILEGLSAIATGGITGDQLDKLPFNVARACFMTNALTLHNLSGASLTAGFLGRAPTFDLSMLTKTQVATIPIETFANLSYSFIDSLANNAASITKPQLAKIWGVVARGLGKAFLSKLDGTILTKEFINLLSKEQCAYLTSTQIKAIPATEFATLDCYQLSQMDPTAIAAINTQQFAKIPANTFRFTSATFINNLNKDVKQTITRDQLSALVPNPAFTSTTVVMADLSIDTLSSLNGANLPPDFLNNLTATQWTKLTSTQIAAIPLNVFPFLSAQTLNNMSAVVDFTATQLAKITDKTVINGLSNAALLKLSGTILTKDFIDKLTGTQCDWLTATQIKAIPTAVYSTLAVYFTFTAFYKRRGAYY